MLGALKQCRLAIASTVSFVMTQNLLLSTKGLLGWFAIQPSKVNNREVSVANAGLSHLH